MKNLQLLSPSLHKHLRVITHRAAEYGEAVHTAPVVLSELEQLVQHYPVCFMKNTETGQFGLYALLGFSEGENVFLQGNNWQAGYVPLHFIAQPFALGATGSSASSQATNLAIYINASSKRINQTQGEAIFYENGSPTPYLTTINHALSQLAHGTLQTQQFIEAMLTNDLVEPAKVNITFRNGDTFNYQGLYTLNVDALSGLLNDGGAPSNVLKQFEAQGYLAPITWLTESMRNIKSLIALKNAQLEQAS